jgi:hypothetical protein
MSQGVWTVKIHLQTVLFALCLTPLLAHAGGKAHVHGVATLDIAVEARKITVQLESPLDNLLGYERTPRTDAERFLHGPSGCGKSTLLGLLAGVLVPRRAGALLGRTGRRCRRRARPRAPTTWATSSSSSTCCPT